VYLLPHVISVYFQYVSICRKMLTGGKNTFKIELCSLLWVYLLSMCLGQYKLNPQWRQICPRIYLSVFTSFAPRGNQTAGAYSKKDDAHSLEECITSCCDEEVCNVVFMHDSTCYHVCLHISILSLFMVCFELGMTLLKADFFCSIDHVCY